MPDESETCRVPMGVITMEWLSRVGIQYLLLEWVPSSLNMSEKDGKGNCPSVRSKLKCVLEQGKLSSFHGFGRVINYFTPEINGKNALTIMKLSREHFHLK